MAYQTQSLVNIADYAWNNGFSGTIIATACEGSGTCTPPAAPAGLQSNEVTQTSLTLQWATVESASSYTVQRMQGSEAVEVGSTSGDSLAIADLPAGTTQQFRVVAHRDCGAVSDPSESLTVQLQSASPPVVTQPSPPTDPAPTPAEPTSSGNGGGGGAFSAHFAAALTGTGQSRVHFQRSNQH